MRSEPNIATWRIGMVLIAAFMTCASALADPPGFRRIQLTNTPKDVEFNPRINDFGHAVWSSRIGGFNNEKKEEVYLSADGVTTRLTSNSVQDRLPDINNDDTVVWVRLDGPGDEFGPTGEIMRWSGQSAEYLTDDKAGDVAPRINNYGGAVWFKYNYEGCGRHNRVIECFDGTRIYDITDGSQSDQIPEINDRGEIVWGRYDFCKDPLVYSVMMYADGESTVLSDGPEAYGPRINQQGVVAWTEDDGLNVWSAGEVTRITDNGTSPYLNSRGDIAFVRPNNELNVWETWLYLGGEIRLIVASEKREAVFDMNERGDIITLSYESDLSKSEVVLYQRLPDGDMNCDERVDFDDIDGFVEAITDRDVYEANNKNCDWWLADCNGDRKIDFNDIDAFVDCLINNGCP